MNKQQTTILILTFLTILIVISYFFYNELNASKKENNQPNIIKTIPAKAIVWQETVTTIGTVKAVYNLDLTSATSGMVQNVYCQSGQSIKAGNLIVSLLCDEEMAVLKKSQAKYNLAQADYQRYRKLYDKKIVSPASLDKILSQLQQIQAEVEAQKAIIAKKQIYAPFDGVLGINNINVGEYILAGEKIASLQALSPIYVDFNIAENYHQDIHVSQTIQITSDSYPGIRWAAKIIAVDPCVNTETHCIRIRAESPNTDFKLLPGMSLKVTLEVGGTRQCIQIPESAILYSPDGQFVYVIDQQQAKRRQVVISNLADSDAVISSGLKAGDKIVIAGQLGLYDKCRVKEVAL